MASSKKSGPLTAIAAAIAGVAALIGGGERMAAKVPFIGRLWRGEAQVQRFFAPAAGVVSHEEKLAAQAAQARRSLSVTATPPMNQLKAGPTQASPPRSVENRGNVAAANTLRIARLRTASNAIGRDIAALQPKMSAVAYQKIYQVWKQHNDAVQKAGNSPSEAALRGHEDEERRLTAEVERLGELYG